MRDDILTFVMDYLQRESDLPEDMDIVTFNFVETGYIDSIGLVQFVTEIEDEYGIEFSDEELQSNDFKVIGSLVALIESKAE